MAEYGRQRPLRTFTRWLRLPLHRRHARRRIERANAQPTDLDTLVDASLDLGTRGLVKVRARQIRSEIRALAAAVAESKPRNIVEIGTFRGGTLWLWSHLATRRVITCDLVQQPRMVELFLRMPPPGSSCRVFPIAGNSRDAAVRARVEDLLEGEPVDFLFIDGDHRLEGVRADFESYAPLVRPGGIIAFHDIAPRQPFPENQVQHLWAELRDRFDVEEFADHPEQVGYGIGLVEKAE
ncbi:MAG TPA: class I SAM-dependent methyltransferase [Myxococcota bacterium]